VNVAGAVCGALAPVAAIARTVAVASRASLAALKNRVNKTSVPIVHLRTLQKTTRKTCRLKPSEIDDQILGHYVNFVNEQLLLSIARIIAFLHQV